MNSVVLIGNLGKDPELAYLPSGTAVANFRIAVKDVRKTNWFSCRAFGKLAEIVEKYLSKGSKVGILGRLTSEEWETDNGRRYTVRVVANRVQFLSRKNGSSALEDAEPF